MSRWLYLLVLFPLLVTSAHADDGWYDDGDVVQSEPITITSPGSKRVILTFPGNPYYVQTPELKNCNRWGKQQGLPKSEWPADPMLDQYITLYARKANRFTGEYVYVLGDSHPGRTQTYCLGVPYLWGE